MFKEKGICAHKNNFGHHCGLPAQHTGDHQCDHEGLRWKWKDEKSATGDTVPTFDGIKLTLAWLTFAGVSITIGEVCEHLGTICRFIAFCMGK